MKSFHQKVYLIRHGETEWTHTRRHTGLTDIPLTEEGRAQAKWLQGRLWELQFKKIFCSPLIRATETCEIAHLFDQAEIDDDLLEWNYGDYEGKTTAEIRETDSKWNIFTSGAPGGESTHDVEARATRVISKVRGIEGDVAIFSSGHFSRCLVAQWLHYPISEGKHFLLSTASCSILGYERETPAIILWNETPT